MLDRFGAICVHHRSQETGVFFVANVGTFPKIFSKRDDFYLKVPR
jgi:hypothetical protein